MRLLNTSTFEIEVFQGCAIPEYAILSHTWEDEEVSLQDFHTDAVINKKGYRKVKGFCEKAASDGFQYCWADTCCIDKTSSAELSEAINSMFQWYKDSRICYAYLADVKEPTNSTRENDESFRNSRWWTRGWTLQELIAPTIVEFYTANWTELGTILSLQDQIAEITGIDHGVLCGVRPFQRNVAVRMSWAARRTTTRIEDQAYCLMGLFGVNMPLLYGEGNRAFRRLQEEIMRVREDYTLFTWAPKITSGFSDPRKSIGLLANAPSDFTDSKGQWTLPSLSKSSLSSWSFRNLSRNSLLDLNSAKGHDPPFLTSRGLRIALPLLEKNPGEFYACLTLIGTSQEQDMMFCVVLNRLAPQSDRYIRRSGIDLVLLPKLSQKAFKWMSIYVMQPAPYINTPPAPHSLAAPAPTPSLIILNPALNEKLSLRPYVSSWIPLDRLISAQSAADDIDSVSVSTSNLSISTTTFTLDESGLYRLRLHKLTHVLSALTTEQTANLSMRTAPELCWFTDLVGARDPSVSGLRGSLGLGNEQQPHLAFLVHLGLFDDMPLCSVVLMTLAELKDDAKREARVADAQTAATLQRDRVTVQSAAGGNGDGDAGVEVTVGVRRVATGPKGIRRFVLSVAQKQIPKEHKGGKGNMKYSSLLP